MIVREKRFIVAGNAQEFAQYIKSVDSEKYEYIYVSDVALLKGYSNPRGVFIGSFMRRPDLYSIVIQIMVSTQFDKRSEGLMGLYEKIKNLPQQSQV